MEQSSTEQLQHRINDLETQLHESEELINAIKSGEVDAFAINKENGSEIYTLQSGDYAYRILIEKFGEGALNVTEEGLIVYTNGYFCQLLGLPYEKVIGANVSEFVHGDSKFQFNELFQKSLSDASKGEINLMAGETLVPVFLSLTSLRPKLQTVGIIVTDFSEKKKTENLIFNYQKSLEQNNKELKKNNAELEAFVYIASHDLQEPLRKIQTFASIIKEKENESLSKSGLDYFQRMESAAFRMQKLIKDLLTYSHTTNTEKKFIYSDLRSVLEEVKDELKEELVATEAKIEYGEMCHAHIITFQFKQLLTNLIGNSLKFTKAEKHPHIVITSEIISGDKVESEPWLLSNTNYCHIRYTDHGIGFQQEYAEKIFELFRRAHSSSEVTGTGIGLAIVKKIVDNHNGVIRASSVLNQGATFDIYLPGQSSKTAKTGLT